MDGAGLKSARVLLVEDNFVILMELESTLQECGAKIVGACMTLESALHLANDGDINVALLDIRLGQDTIATVARRLARRGIPFAFYTAQTEADPSLAEWPEAIILEKPASPKAIVAALVRMLRPR
jgi:DNA-binding LytR/AlgR family response regulator